jgi:catechol 2,3-dioxygenase-like lactoylglutathione lyase family enzyme
MADWFARPVLHVTDVEASLRFYVDQLGFTSPWRYEGDGRVHVAQVDKQGCALILADTWPEKIGKGLMFISLNVEPATREAAIAALDALRAELEAKGVLVKDGSWGYRLLVVDDPDGNQLFFNYPAETASSGGNHHVRLLSPEPLVVKQPKFTRVEEPTFLCNHFQSKPISETDIDEQNSFRRRRLLQESSGNGASEIQGCQEMLANRPTNLQIGLIADVARITKVGWPQWL